MAIAGVISLILLGLMGTPLFVVMLALGLVLFIGAGIEGSAVPVEMYRLASAPTLTSIPLFTLAGLMMARSKTPDRLLAFFEASLGRFPGGVSFISLVLCAFFTAFTGASGVTILALGGLLLPLLIKEGMKDNFALGLVTTAGAVGLLFAPSLPLILYGIVGKVDIEKLFLAGIVPGIIFILIYTVWAVKNAPTRQREAFSWKKVKESSWNARFELPLPILVLAGIYGGVVTVTEAAALTSFYVFVMEFFLYRDLRLDKDLVSLFSESAMLVGAILIILCSAMGVTSYLIDEEIPMKLLEFMQQWITNKYLFLLGLNVFLLIVGCLMDVFSAIIVVVPLILPMADVFGINPIHMAIIFLANLEIGFITPPVGINLFISSFRFGKPMLELYRSVWPFVLISFIALMLITYIPALSLFWFDL